MAAVHIHKRTRYFWRNAAVLKTVAMSAAVVSVAPGTLLAQTAAIVEQTNAPQACKDLSAEHPIALAAASFGNVEPSAGPANLSKSQAILGGLPSKLEQMRFAQLSSDTASIMPTESQSQQVQLLTKAACPSLNPDTVPTIIPSYDNSVSDNAILGAMSISIKKTPFDRKWAALNVRRNSRQIQQTLFRSGADQGGSETEKVEAINKWVNSKIEFGEDRDVYGRADYWATASETLRRGVGDCEDFAIAKMELLSALGISRDRMRLVVARDLVRNADHAVLVVMIDNGAVMLDNMTDRLLDARLPNDYRPIMSFSQNAKWVHGYAVKPAQAIRMASVSPVPQPATRRDPELLTVTDIPEMPAAAVAILIVPSALRTVLL
jgi:predicted transglutaminase-like cysteine proteinase